MPELVTTRRGTEAAAVPADNQGLIDRIDIFEIEQFVAQHRCSVGLFSASKQREQIVDLITCYNAVVHAVESKSGLTIEIRSVK